MLVLCVVPKICLKILGNFNLPIFRLSKGLFLLIRFVPYSLYELFLLIRRNNPALIQNVGELNIPKIFNQILGTKHNTSADPNKLLSLFDSIV